MIARMNAWGPDGCQEHRDEIINTLMDGKARLSIWLQAAIIAAAPLARIVCDDMLDEAILRAEADHVADAGMLVRHAKISEKSKIAP